MYEGSELTIYLKDGRSVSLPLNALETAVMLRSIGANFHGNLIDVYGERTLNDILAGNLNPFTLKATCQEDNDQ